MFPSSGPLLLSLYRGMAMQVAGTTQGQGNSAEDSRWQQAIPEPSLEGKSALRPSPLSFPPSDSLLYPLPSRRAPGREHAPLEAVGSTSYPVFVNENSSTDMPAI